MIGQKVLRAVCTAFEKPLLGTGELQVALVDVAQKPVVAEIAARLVAGENRQDRKSVV